MCSSPWKFLIALALGGITALATAQEKPPANTSEWTIRTWTTRDGLPQNSVNSILQTRDGYLWVGTRSGLARFDGVQFRVFGLQDGLKSVHVSKLVEDAKGRLWIGTFGGGLACWEANRFITLTRADGLLSNEVTALDADTQGRIWIGTEQGLQAWKNGVFERFDDKAGVPSKAIRAIKCSEDGTTWVSVLVEGLFRSDGGRFVQESGGAAPTPPVYSLSQDASGALWAGGGNASLWRRLNGKWTGYGRQDGVPFSYINALSTAGQSLWVGTAGSGVFEYRDGKFAHVPLVPSAEDRIICLYTDRDQTLWIGSAGEGLSRLAPRKIRHWGFAHGLRTQPLSIAEDGAGRWWVASQNSGIFRLIDGQFQDVRDAPQWQGFQAMHAVIAASDGSVWVGGSSCLFRFRPDAPPVTYLDPPIKDDAILSICQDDNRIWLGTLYSKLIKVEHDRVTLVADQSTFSGGVRALLAEGPNILWIGTGDGLHRWDNGKLETWNASHGLVAAAVRVFHRDPDGVIWIGTNGAGLARLKQGRITHLTMRHGLRDNTITQILPDDHGHLWLGSNRGIMRVHRQELSNVADGRSTAVHPIVFGIDDGMPDEQCASGQSAIKTRGGNLLFLTSRGVVQIDPRQWLTTSNKPQSRIEEVIVDEKPQSPGSTLVLPHNHRSIEIRYSGLSLHKPDSINFRVRLDGLDKNWIERGASRSVSYSALPPRRYQLLIAACDSEGNWTPVPASLDIIVQPPWWETLWFRSVVAAAGLALAALVFFHRRNLRRRKEHARKAFTQQLLLSQEAERKRIASELHDGLGQNLLVIKNRLNMLEAQASHWPDGVAQLAQISSNTSQALAEVREISHGLRPSAIEQVGLTHAIQWMIDQVSQTTDTRFSAELDNVDRLLTPDMEINLFRIAQEAINNVLKHAGASQVIITLKREEDQIALSVFDDGKGFDPDEHRNGNGSRPAFGLTGLKERADLLGGTIHIHSAPAKGTRLSLAVPLGGN